MTVRSAYGISSLIALSAGFLCYYFFRDSNLIFYNIFNINIAHNNVYLSHNFFSDFLRYNLCDGLWLFSGILLLRFIWFDNSVIGNYYRIIFICVAFLLELLQLTAYFPGTFDILDMFTMVIFALLERCIYWYTFGQRSLKMRAVLPTVDGGFRYPENCPKKNGK